MLWSRHGRGCRATRTFPLALSPVNQIVTPFWASSVARSSAFTEPAMPRPIHAQRPPINTTSTRTSGVTLVESNVGGHFFRSFLTKSGT